MGKSIFISAVILAGGESKRMGQPKLLMQLGNTTIIEQTICNVLNSRVNETIVVLGYQADEIRNRLSDKQIRTIVNPAYFQGISTSIQAGIKSIDAQAQGVLIGLGDTPFVDSQTINRLIDEFYTSKKGIVIPVCQGNRGHPKIFSVKYLDALMKLKGDKGGRQIISRYRADVLEVQVA